MSDVKLLRRVILFDNATQAKKDFQSSATTWVDLKRELSNMGVSVANCKFIEGATKLTFEQDSAALPLKDFVFFRLPVSTKSAAYTSKEANLKIREIIEVDASAKNHFTGYSSMKVDELNSKIDSYLEKNKKATKTTTSKKEVVKKEVVKPVTKTVTKTPAKAVPAKKVETVKSAKTESKSTSKVTPKTAPKATTKITKEKIVNPKWLELIQQAVDIAPTHVANELNYIISKELEIPIITDDVQALAVMARQLR